jgi:hypothetical protein
VRADAPHLSNPGRAVGHPALIPRPRMPTNRSGDRFGPAARLEWRDRIGDPPLVGRCRTPGECSVADGPTRRCGCGDPQRQRGCRLLSWSRGAWSRTARA